MPGQWELQVVPAVGISAGDEIWVDRERITEIAGVIVSLDPKPIKDDWNGAGAHCNYSTNSMREDGWYEVILKAIEKLSHKHKEHIAAFGEGNDMELQGGCLDVDNGDSSSCCCHLGRRMLRLTTCSELELNEVVDPALKLWRVN
ncbi:hypothetical protein MKX03_033438 [Papaver bracteatum]|nr:hypothetical protein MKX03_033438 [Papaver bracteatum]